MAGRVSRRDVLWSAAAAAAVALAPRAVFGKAQKPPIKLVQFGTAHAHASKISVYRKSEDYEVLGLVEPDDKRWARVSNDAAYKDLPRLTEEQALNLPGVQAVTVETAVAELVPTGTRCLAAGKHIHLDKPGGTDLQAFAKLLDLATQKKRLVQMGYMLRYSPATQLLRRLTKEGALGEVFEVTAVMSKVVAAGERKTLAQFQGGMMFELGCHIIDQVVGLLGRPLKITPYAQSVVGDGLKDSMLAVFEYPKATATVRSSALEVDGGSRRQFVVCGTGGTLKTEPLEPPMVRLSLANAFAEFKKGSQDVPMPKYGRYISDAADMAAVIRGEKPDDFPPSHDLLVHECLLKASGMV